MGEFIANKVIKLMIQNNVPTKGAKVLVLGITFKENCADLRNSRVIDVLKELKLFGLEISVFDPKANAEEVSEEYSIQLCKHPEKYHAIIHAVAHDEFKSMDIRSFLLPNGVLYDVKSTLPREWVDGRL